MYKYSVLIFFLKFWK